MLNRSIGLFGIGLPPTTVSISAFILCILLTIISILGVYKLKKWVLWTWGVILLLNLLFITDSFVTDIFWLSSLIFNLFYNLLMDRIKQFKNSFQQ
jgi:ABC-type multidrug transport system permease subunit